MRTGDRERGEKEEKGRQGEKMRELWRKVHEIQEISAKQGAKIHINIFNCATADFILKVLGVYTRSMETIYLSLRVGTFFMKSPVYVKGKFSKARCNFFRLPEYT